MDFIGISPIPFVRRASYALEEEFGSRYLNICVERYRDDSETSEEAWREGRRDAEPL
jgi:hypothetical protein